MILIENQIMYTTEINMKVQKTEDVKMTFQKV